MVLAVASNHDLLKTDSFIDFYGTHSLCNNIVPSL